MTKKKYASRKKIRGRWREFYRITWTENGKRRERYIEIHAERGTKEYDIEYWKIQSGLSEKTKAPPSKTSYGELIKDYRSSPAFLRLKPSTKTSYDRVLNRLVEKNEHKDFTKVTKKGIRAVHKELSENPRKADWFVQIMSILCNHAINELEWMTHNPAKGIDLYGPTKEWEPWPTDLQDAWVRYCLSPHETKEEARYKEIALLAYHLGTGTGQRPGDICEMEWDHFKDGYMEVMQEKTDERLWIYCPERLQAFLKAMPRNGKFILAKNLTEPLSYDTVEHAFRYVRRKIGDNAKGYVMHGWRYTAAVELAEAGCSDAEIQSVTGHKSLEMVKKYRSQARQKELSKQAQMRRDAARNSEQ